MSVLQIIVGALGILFILYLSSKLCDLFLFFVKMIFHSFQTVITILLFVQFFIQGMLKKEVIDRRG